MNNQEIVRALYRLADDLRDLRTGRVAKQSALQLLTSQPGSNGGPLVRMLAAETDDRAQAVIREATAIVVHAYQERIFDHGASADKLVALAKRLDADKGGDWLAVNVRDLLPARTTRYQYAKQPEQYGLRRCSKVWEVRRDKLRELIKADRLNTYE